MIVIVPNTLRDAINKELDANIALSAPDMTVEEREIWYNYLLNFYNDNGYVPRIIIEKKR